MSKSKYNNAFKSEVLKNGTVKLVSKIKRDKYKASCETSIDYDGVINFTMVNGILCDWLEYAQQVPSLDCSLRLIESRKKKTKKVHSKIEHLVKNDNAIFITLTFNDKTLSNTTPSTRRRYVARYLKENCYKYVANIDFGSDKEYIDFQGNKRKGTNREHYHAVVNKDIDFSKWYKYGAIKIERVRAKETDTQRISRYITKLTYHALKVGENAPRLIYSRNI